MNRWVRFSQRLHRRLARAFPHEFQVLHGNELEQMGDDAIPFVWRQYGFLGLVKLLSAALVELIGQYLTEFGQDLRYAGRRLSATPGFTALAILSLGLCIGMSSLFPLQMAGFSAPAPGIKEPDSLVAPETLISYPYFEEYRKQTSLFSASAAYVGPVSFTVGNAEPGSKRERISGHIVTPDYFSTLGVAPIAGRVFDTRNDIVGSEPSVIITESYWRTHLDANAGAVGSTLRVNGQDTTIVGITGDGFRGAFPTAPGPAEIFVPATSDPSFVPELRGDLLHSQATRFRALFRLADGATRTEAEAALTTVARNLDQQRSESERPEVERTISLLDAGVSSPLPRELLRQQWIFGFVLSALILGVACANLAVLLLARGSERRKEIAIRLSVGASRLRMVRQQLTESIVLALPGGVLGLFVLLGIFRVSVAIAPEAAGQIETNYGGALSMAPFVFGFSALAGLIFGLAPAVSSVRGELLTPLKQGAQAHLRGYSRFGIRNQFMLFQISASLLLLLLTGYVVIGYQNVYKPDLGFEADNLYLMALDPARDGYSTQESSVLLERLRGRIENLPEVDASALSLDMPFSQMLVTPGGSVTTTGADGKQAIHRVVHQRIGEGYFIALGVPLVSGREFTIQDQLDSTESSGKKIILNQTAAGQLFGEGNPLGQTVRENGQLYSVVGIVKDLRSGLMMAKAAPTMFLPLTAVDLERTFSQGLTLLLRGRPGAAAVEAASAEILVFDPKLTVFNARAFQHDFEQFNRLIEWSTTVNGGLAVFAFLLSLVGLFSVTVHAVARRRKEIGIRVALGARRDQVLRLVLREGAALVVVGGVLGFAGAYALTRLLSSMTSRLAELLAVSIDDPLFVAGVPLAWGALAMLACYLPARRAMRIDPASTLKAE
jgi:predicted permease